MEHKSADVSHEKEAAQPAAGLTAISEGIPKPAQTKLKTSGDVNMEASISPEDVIRAGGFGSRDDISSFLPVATDWTDFEALIREARDYEEAEGEVNRPGLGWSKESKPE